MLQMLAVFRRREARMIFDKEAEAQRTIKPEAGSQGVAPPAGPPTRARVDVRLDTACSPY